MSDFAERVFEEVKKIPKGKVATYGQIAALAGSPRACRAVGNILHTNPMFIEIPCHRVVNSNGRLAKAFVFGGEHIQKEVLEKEGVKVNDNYYVDMKKYQWHFVKFEVPYEISKILSRFEENEFEAYIVGGCVRDFLMGRVPSDYDITTNATPVEVKRLFTDCKVIETGIKHGTVTVIINSVCVEITTYRIDGKYLDNRRPEEVIYTSSLEEDLERRDFTINAMAYSESQGIVDYFGGLEDINERKIRAVGDANKRFKEDALRIMRAIRFSAVLGFDIEKKTSKAIKENALLLSNIAKERIAVELNKIVCADRYEVFLEYIDVFSVFIPELKNGYMFNQNNKYHIYDVLTHCLKAMINIEPVVHLRLAALLHDVEKPSTYTVDDEGVGHFYGHCEKSADTAKKILRRLRYDNFTRDRIYILVKYHDSEIVLSKKNVKRWLAKLGVDVFKELILLKRADNFAQAPEVRDRQKYYDEVDDIAEQIILEQCVLSISDLDIDGKDLLEFGVKEGKDIGRILEILLEEVLEENIENKKEQLLVVAQGFI